GALQWNWSPYTSGNDTFNNSGTFRKSAGGTFNLSDVQFSSSGIVVLDGGLLAQPLSISAGSFIANSDAFGMSLTLGGSATAQFNVLQHLAALMVNGNASAAMAAGDGGLNVGSLGLGPGARLDLSDNDLV